MGTKKSTRRHSLVLVFLATLMAFLGLIMIFNVSSVSALTDFNDKYHYAREQSQWIVLGLVSMIFFSYYNYRHLYSLSLPVLIGSYILLLSVFIKGFGIHALGASRWVDLGFVSFQPVEIVKLTLIVYLSAWLSRDRSVRFSHFLLLMTIVIVPIIAQPDLGSTVILALIGVGIYFASGAPYWQFTSMLTIVVAALGGLAVSTPYRLERVRTFLNPDLDPSGSSYHLRQILIAIGTGGWFGIGLGKSRQKFSYLPEVTTDSIFAVIAEEIGFIGCTIILCLFLVLILMGIKIASRAPDKFGKLLGLGIIIAISMQIIVNLASMVSLLPLTGIPLPFLSYGGSSLIISFMMIGILVSIDRRTHS